MQGGSGFNSMPATAPLDKLAVLDVKPLRSLKPIFTTSQEAPPYVCATPEGPFPPGFSPFYPFMAPPPPPPPPPPVAMAPIRSFRSPMTADNVMGMVNGDEEGADDGSTGRKRRSARSRAGKIDKSQKNQYVAPRVDYVPPISSFKREEGSKEVVNLVMMHFDGLRRRLSQLDDSKEIPSGLARRADLRAANLMMSKGFRTNMRKRIGSVPGVEIGDIFFFRMEMCAVGLHAQAMGGIDWLHSKGDLEEESLAVSIVSSGYYNDDADDKDVLVYSGQGGGAGLYKDKPADQKLERGNLALNRSMRRANEIRVIRGMRDATTPGLKIYVYDGLYTIQESWVEKGKSGGNTFKYKLMRMPGQAEAFGLWKMVEKWKEDPSSRPGLILPDLTSGAETIPVYLVNDIDDEKGPAYFTYCPTPKHSKSSGVLQTSYGCGCHRVCVPGDLNCSCIRKNNGDLPYTNGILVSQKSLVYECRTSCPCGPPCKNRVAQAGIKIRMEVFKTKNRGWGLRAYEAIRAGTFICEYAGEVIDKDRLKQKVREGENDEYIFDTSRVQDPIKWNYEPALLGEDSADGPSDDSEVPSPLIISAKDIGNVARFMNHSCEPNVLWQPVVWEADGQVFLHVAFFAIKHIPILTELTYDYGVVPEKSDVGGGAYRKRKCLCGASKCRGFYGL